MTCRRVAIGTALDSHELLTKAITLVLVTCVFSENVRNPNIILPVSTQYTCNMSSAMRRLLVVLSVVATLVVGAIATTIQQQQPPPLYINVGGPNYTDINGNLWISDNSPRIYNTGKTFRTLKTIKNAIELQPVYQTERWTREASLQFDIAVDRGDYLVRLLFAEVYFTTVGKRILNVYIEDSLAWEGVDIVSQADGGAYTALTMDTKTTVHDGVLSIRLDKVLQNPKLNGIVVLPWFGVDGFVLVNADTNIDIDDNCTPCRDSSASLNLRANVFGSVSSVEFTLNGPGNYKHVQVENVAPFSAFGDVDGDYFGNEFGIPGIYTVTAVAYTEQNGQGLASTPYTSTFEIVPAEPFGITSFVLVNADTNQDMPGALDCKPFVCLGNKENLFNIRATTFGNVQSVMFSVSGPITNMQLEEETPFSLFGDTTGDYVGSQLLPGRYNVTAWAFRKSMARGESSTFSMVFEIAEETKPTPLLTSRPSQAPTPSPTPEPTPVPVTPQPTLRPTPQPTPLPTSRPSQAPTPRPNPDPTPGALTRDPTPGPTPQPTPLPTSRPSQAPTQLPTPSPTPNPVTPKPTPRPTPEPTPLPTSRPSQAPTPRPNPDPTPGALTREPTPGPTPQPTTLPTSRPSQAPTQLPTPSPTPNPVTPKPTPRPTPEPTPLPTSRPSQAPTPRPTPGPTPDPVTPQPTLRPTPTPTPLPTSRPSRTPTPRPTPQPTPVPPTNAPPTRMPPTKSPPTPAPPTAAPPTPIPPTNAPPTPQPGQNEFTWDTNCVVDTETYDYCGKLEFCSPSQVRFGYRQVPGGTCSSPGQSIRINNGKRYLLTLVNNVTNTVTNLHTHGLHISGDGNADDVTRYVEFNHQLHYVWDFRKGDHMGGTYWYHAHHHGETYNQVNKGALAC